MDRGRTSTSTVVGPEDPMVRLAPSSPEGHLPLMCWTPANFSPPVPQDHRRDTSLPLPVQLVHPHALWHKEEYTKK